MDTLVRQIVRHKTLWPACQARIVHITAKAIVFGDRVAPSRLRNPVCESPAVGVVTLVAVQLFALSAVILVSQSAEVAAGARVYDKAWIGSISGAIKLLDKGLNFILLAIFALVIAIRISL